MTTQFVTGISERNYKEESHLCRVEGGGICLEMYGRAEMDRRTSGQYVIKYNVIQKDGLNFVSIS